QRGRHSAAHPLLSGPPPPHHPPPLPPGHPPAPPRAPQPPGCVAAGAALMTRPILEGADRVRQDGAASLARDGATVSPEQHRALRAIAVCRTAALGGHATQCEKCGHLEITYNSCGHRHCPKSPGRAQAAWLAARAAELLDVPYVQRLRLSFFENPPSARPYRGRC